MWLAVRITLGKPPHWFTYPYEEVRLLALPPRVFRLRDDRAFEGAYEQHLEAVGVEPYSGSSRTSQSATRASVCPPETLPS
jgi:hypothetical protein